MRHRRWQCRIGWHNLVSYTDAGDGIHVMQVDPRRSPGPGATRKCLFCGAAWEGRYDGTGDSSWWRVRPPFWKSPPVVPKQDPK